MAEKAASHSQFTQCYATELFYRLTLRNLLGGTVAEVKDLGKVTRKGSEGKHRGGVDSRTFALVVTSMSSAAHP